MEAEEQEILNEQKAAEAKRIEAVKKNVAAAAANPAARQQDGRLSNVIFLALGVGILSLGLYFFV